MDKTKAPGAASPGAFVLVAISKWMVAILGTDSPIRKGIACSRTACHRKRLTAVIKWSRPNRENVPIKFHMRNLIIIQYKSCYNIEHKKPTFSQFNKEKRSKKERKCWIIESCYAPSNNSTTLLLLQKSNPILPTLLIKNIISTNFLFLPIRKK